MKAIILAAGIGKRLGGVADDKPKCLLEIDGISLLHRHLQILENLGVHELLIVSGYQQADILTEIKNYSGSLQIKTVFNPDFTSGSVVSLRRAHSTLEAGQDIILMDADVLYHPDILKRLVTTEHENCFLLDRDFEAGDEPVKICVRNNQMIEFRKILDTNLLFDFQGESVGFFKFNADLAHALSDRCLYYIEHGKVEEPYEEVLRDLLLEDPQNFNYEDISGLAWIEIDFPEDYKRASEDILNRIS
ncbi:MAG: NTP transferase domain-containing protein [Gammaproteobacteria bacterium]|nr:NTP transferase domain-containing protein [Gammaproteobacteria bacterium]